MHTVAILAMDGVVAFDLSVPIEVFGRACLPDGQAAYQVRICAAECEIDAGTFRLRVPWGLDRLTEADTIIIPGAADPTMLVARDVIIALQSASARGTRIASICGGAFILAAAGLLDGLRATTHWVAAGELARRYPAITVDANVLFVDNGQILTSAGAAAGLDLCLHLIRRDYGSAVAAEAARISVMPLVREGGQAQFIMREPPPPDGVALEPVLRWMEDNAHRELSLDDIASQAMMSTRTLTRRFREQTGVTPLHWLNRSRVRKAQCLLETTNHSIQWIASYVGYSSETTFRDRFKRIVSLSPRAYRRAFRGTAATEFCESSPVAPVA
jgi:transcriptional regulator GlxA family with amidase domain